MTVEHLDPVHLYFIYCWDGPYHYLKIGIAADVSRRLGQLQVGSPFPLELSYTARMPNRKMAQHFEARVHELLAEVRMRGEWFYCGFDVGWLALEVARGNRPLSDLQAELAVTPKVA